MASYEPSAPSKSYRGGRRGYRRHPASSEKLDPNAAVFLPQHPSQQYGQQSNQQYRQQPNPQAGMTYSDLMYYNCSYPENGFTPDHEYYTPDQNAYLSYNESYNNRVPYSNQNGYYHSINDTGNTPQSVPYEAERRSTVRRGASNTAQRDGRKIRENHNNRKHKQNVRENVESVDERTSMEDVSAVNERSSGNNRPKSGRQSKKSGQDTRDNYSADSGRDTRDYSGRDMFRDKKGRGRDRNYVGDSDRGNRELRQPGYDRDNNDYRPRRRDNSGRPASRGRGRGSPLDYGRSGSESSSYRPYGPHFEPERRQHVSQELERRQHAPDESERPLQTRPEPRNTSSKQNSNDNGDSVSIKNGQGQKSTVDKNIDIDKDKTKMGKKNESKKKFEDFDFRREKLSTEVLETQRGRLIEDLTNNTYECMVCCDIIKKAAAVWSCGECYHVFHLFCIKKWARSECALLGSDESGGWRCPGCQNVTPKTPNQYLCFCTKQRNPEYSPYETPHSCGEVCGKSRGGQCTHKCNILCHPGPCPDCQASVTKYCDCGKSSKSVKCSQTAERCELPCDKKLNCRKHNCKIVCHSGQCSPCQETTGQYCHCGKGFRKVYCGTEESLLEFYSCGEICGKTLTCGNHRCEKPCHSGDCDVCSLAPESITVCCCGKTELKELDVPERTSCTDPIPFCDKICNKELICGPPSQHHRCSLICHQGSCAVCDDDVTPVSCRCEATVKEMTCKEAEPYLNGEDLLCTRRCNKKRDCGKHRCQQPCCDAADHSCTQTCGRKLTCGLHRCEEPCHRGNCDTCWNVCFEEITCHCGVSVLDPPIPCGTKPPECPELCQRPHPCEHPARHNCHSEEKCPPCVVLTDKLCLGGHERRSNIPCHITDISCGLACDKPLPCKHHRCIRICHKGECLNDDEECLQACSKPRPWCDHPCGVPCHPGSPCPETVCEAKIDIKCVCGNRSETTMCGAGKKDAQAKIYQQMTNSSMMGKIIYVGNGQTVDLSALNSQKRLLECSEDCAKLERNRRLALALQIENPDVSDKLAPSYNQFLKDFARVNPAFVAEIEKALTELVQNAKSSKYPNRSHSFKPMKREQRKFIHEIAEFYGCKTQSYDYEPVKSVVATAYKGKCWMPSMTLTASIKRETSAPLPIPHNSTEKEIRAKMTASRLSTNALHSGDDAKKTKNVSRQTFVDYFDYASDDD